MLIIFQIILGLLFCYVSGFALIGTLTVLTRSKRSIPAPWQIMPACGYCFSQFLFVMGYIYLDGLTGARMAGMYFPLALALIPFIWVYKYKQSQSSHLSFLPQHAHRPLFFAAAFIAILAAWPYIWIGQGHYYHSGNEDFIIDGVNGARLFLQNVPHSEIPEGYTDFFPLQYSSQAFWSSFFFVNPMDGFVLQAILNLTISIFGIYWLSTVVFDFSQRVSVWTALFSVGANFYFTTYLSGHIGSMIYYSIAPVFAGLLILWVRRELGPVWLCLAIAFYILLRATYPGPANFIVVPAVFLFINERILIPTHAYTHIANFFGFEIQPNLSIRSNRPRIIRIFVALLVILAAALAFHTIVWKVFAPIRTYSSLRPNASWSIALCKEIVLLIWGVFPSLFIGARWPFPYLYQLDSIYWFAWIVSLGITYMAIAGGLRSATDERRRFLFAFVLCYPVFFAVMRFYWGSSYYFYKFLYVNYFFYVIAIAAFLFPLATTHHRWRKPIIIALLVFIFPLNCIWTLRNEIDIIQRPYHKLDVIDDLLHNVDREVFSQCYLDIPVYSNLDSFRTMFAMEDIPFTATRSDAKYLLQLKQIRNLFPCVLHKPQIHFENECFRIVTKPIEDSITLTPFLTQEHLSYPQLIWAINPYNKITDRLTPAIEDAIEIIQTSNMSSRTYIDIRDTMFFCVVHEFLRSKRIELQPDPTQSSWFIRINTDTIRSHNRQFTDETVFELHPNERVVFQNYYFRIIERPPTVPLIAIPNTRLINLHPLFYYIDEFPHKIFFDLPPYEHIALYILQALKEKGIENVSANETEYVCRFSLDSPYQNFEYKSVEHPDEEIVWSLRENLASPRVTFDIKIVRIPHSGRKTLSPVGKFSLPYALLSSVRSGDFGVALNDLTSQSRYLRCMLKPGPSLDLEPFTILITSDQSSVQKSYRVEAPYSIVDIPLADFIGNHDGFNDMILWFKVEDVIGHSLLPIDDRLLECAVLGAVLTDRIDTYPDLFVIQMNGGRSIGDAILATDNCTVAFGRGWYDWETFSGQTFRWAKQTAEILFKNISAEAGSVCIELEPLFASAEQPFAIESYYKEQKISSHTLHGRNTITIDIPDTYSGHTDIWETIVLRCNKPVHAGRKAGKETRDLAFRAFSMSIQNARENHSRTE